MEEIINTNNNQLVNLVENYVDVIKSANTGKVLVMGITLTATVAVVETIKKGFKLSTKNFELSVGM